MNVEEIDCKTALSLSKLPGLTYSLNPYSGCQHQCIYCYVPSVLHLPKEIWASSLKVKRNIPFILAKELQKKKPGIVGLSTVTDPYQPLEKTYQLTRYCLQQLLKKEFPVCIQTKSSLVLRDIDIITRFSQIEVMMSIGTDDESHRRILEPGSSPISERLKALKAYGETKVKTSVFFGPIYPTITIEQLPRILDSFIDAHVDEIMIDMLHMKPGLQQHIKETLTDNPQLSKAFSSGTSRDKEWFTTIRETIQRYLKHTDIIVVDAF
jgi:DNA repair photolyase